MLCRFVAHWWFYIYCAWIETSIRKFITTGKVEARHVSGMLWSLVMCLLQCRFLSWFSSESCASAERCLAVPSSGRRGICTQLSGCGTGVYSHVLCMGAICKLQVQRGRQGTVIICHVHDWGPGYWICDFSRCFISTIIVVVVVVGEAGWSSTFCKHTTRRVPYSIPYCCKKSVCSTMT